MIITIDGLTGTGKTTVAKSLADNLKIFHLKGGIFFRSLTYLCQKSNIFDKNQIINIANDINIQPVVSNNLYQIYIDNENVTENLWTSRVNIDVSKVADIQEVRELRISWLRKFSKDYNLVADGRTLGSEVFPNAKHKFYLICNINKRAERALASGKYGNDVDIIQTAITQRDKQDKEGAIDRSIIPKDAIVIDTTNLCVEMVVNKMLSYVDSFSIH